MEIRPADRGDAAAIAAIYNAGIDGRAATFDTEHRTPEHVGEWLADRRPLLVAVEGGEVVGWARAAPYSPKAYYDGVAEASIYVAEASRGHGVGSGLMAALAEAAEAAGVYKLVGKLFAGHETSRALVARHGFRAVGTHIRHGRLDGEWRDVVLVELPLGEAAAGSSGEVAVAEAAVRFWYAGDREGFLGVFHPQGTWSSAIKRRVEGGEGLYRGREGIGEFWDEWHSVWDDLSIVVSDFRRPRAGWLLGIGALRAKGAGSGAGTEQPFNWVFRIEDGLIREVRAYLDRDEALRAAGISE